MQKMQRKAEEDPLQYKCAATTRGKHSQCKISNTRLQYETITGVLDLDDRGVCLVAGILKIDAVVKLKNAAKEPPPPLPLPLPPPQQPQMLVEKDATL
ncbi:hypothetical protein ALC62_04548 [Cyphomyrmex costatus]|uniref:Uncharacterized protein n=1 Tax=Cyphomyrmex costatus TaxID=456900 RepID=A0A195CVJ3_9HYME|nr:hypothetical protein ALC62_04548 [Cyphomyrmex costatus]